MLKIVFWASRKAWSLVYAATKEICVSPRIPALTGTCDSDASGPQPTHLRSTALGYGV